MTLLKRMALVIDAGVVAKVFYPVFPPDQNAAEVIAWLREATNAPPQAALPTPSKYSRAVLKMASNIAGVSTPVFVL